MSLPRTNTQVLLASHPVGRLGEEHFKISDGKVPELGKDDVLVRNIYSSVEPYLRVLMKRETSFGNTPYGNSFEINTVLPARVVGEVAGSRHPNYREGDFVFGMLRWEDYSLAAGGQGLRKVDPTLAPLSAYLGALGPSGLTAYIGMLEVGNPQPGEVVYVSAAAGAVGQLAGQLAKLRGARVIGSVGSDEKVAYVINELGFDKAFNYKKTSDLAATLRAACPDGINLNFENVGGENLDAALECICPRGRVVLCGTVSQYDADNPRGVKNLAQLVVKEARMLGFSVRYHEDQLPDFIAQMSEWLRSGRIKYREHITRGLKNGPAALIGMLHGQNLGKQILQIGDDSGASRQRGSS
jgi:NADPH-dependent curcumin reductase CurA